MGRSQGNSLVDTRLQRPNAIEIEMGNCLPEGAEDVRVEAFGLLAHEVILQTTWFQGVDRVGDEMRKLHNIRLDTSLYSK